MSYYSYKDFKEMLDYWDYEGDFEDSLPEINPEAAMLLSELETQEMRFYADEPWSGCFTGECGSNRIAFIIGDPPLTDTFYIWITINMPAQG